MPGYSGLFHRILEETPEGADAVFPADLLALLVSATPIADANFVNPQMALGDLHGDLRLETKAVFLDRDGLNHFAAESFVTRLHVAEVDVGQAIGEQGEQPISHKVPEIKHAMWTGADKARAVNHVGFTVDQRFKEGRIIRRIVLEISVLNNDKIAGSLLDAAPERRSLAQIARLQKDTEVLMLALELGENVPGTIGRTVIHAEQFELQWNAEYALHDESERATFVIDGHYDG